MIVDDGGLCFWQRDAIIREYVAAKAKEALRENMSEETCAGLIRLVSAVSAAG